MELPALEQAALREKAALGRAREGQTRPRFRRPALGAHVFIDEALGDPLGVKLEHPNLHGPFRRCRRRDQFPELLHEEGRVLLEEACELDLKLLRIDEAALRGRKEKR